MVTISSNFDGGSIECVDVSDPGAIRLNLKTDPDAEESYWFFFRLAGARGTKCRLRIDNAGDAWRLAERKGTEIPGPWQDYRACASYDLQNWFRVPTEYRGGSLKMSLTPQSDAVYFASFPTYSAERHAQFIARAAASPDAVLQVLGKTCDGNDIDMLRIGTPAEGRKVCWIVGRQHPSETMGEWFVQAFAERLIDADDFLARRLLGKAVFYVVPCMNPDGARRGNTRRNGGNLDLNRAWVEPSRDKSPEVFFVREMMHRTGVDFFMDVHGDEELPYVFLGGPLEVPSLTDRMRQNFYAFEKALTTANPDYKTGYAYPGGPPPTADLRMAWNYVGETFGCLSILVEQPFKDCEHAPDEEKGWSAERSRRLGAASLVALNAVLDDLR